MRRFPISLLLLCSLASACVQSTLELPPCDSDADCTETQVCRQPASGGNKFCVDVSDIRNENNGQPEDMRWVVEPDASADMPASDRDMDVLSPDMNAPRDMAPGCDTCASVGANCGMIPDGCGNMLACGTCGAGENCGGGGPNVCGPDACQPTTCQQQQSVCGDLSDGCGGFLSCGDCAGNQVCMQGQCVCADCGLHAYDAGSKSWSKVSLQANSTHQPSSQTSAAVLIEANDTALIFTNSSYHVLDLAQRRWTGSGLISQVIPQIADYQVTAGNGLADEMSVTHVVLTTRKNATAKVLVGTYDATSGTFGNFSLDDFGDDWGAVLAPDATRLRAAWIDIENTVGGVVEGTPDGLCPNAEGVGAYLAVQALLTDTNLHLYDASYCAAFSERLAFTRFTPFAAANSPDPTRIHAAFYRDKKLYVVVGEEPLR
jgi:hypothetical protein